MIRTLQFFALILPILTAHAGEWPRELKAYRGTSPTIDGVLSSGEWEDATAFAGTQGWTSQFSVTTDPRDLSLKGWVKYDDRRLHFAFDVTDDILYGIDTERWLPDNNPHAHELSRRGWPWFGDEIELLINASNRWEGNEEPRGDGHSWQMVCNLTKSRLGGIGSGGIGSGGLLEGEPRVKESAWNRYQQWIKSGAMQAVAKPKSGGKGYIIEWSVAFDPCLELEPGRCFKAGDTEVVMGLNIALGDLDIKATGSGNFGNFHHEDWFAGEKGNRTNIRQWGTLRLIAGAKPKVEPTKP